MKCLYQTAEHGNSTPNEAPKTQTKIYAYGGKIPLSVLRTFITEVESRRRMTSATFYVVKEVWFSSQLQNRSGT